MRGKKKRTKASRSVFLAKDIAELVIKRYPTLSLHDVKSGLMSAEQFIINTMYCYRKDNDADSLN